jgi:hypothetical protein
MEGNHNHEIDSDDGNKSKESSPPLWKYVTNLEGGKGGGTTKFTCPPCKKNSQVYILV